MTSGVFHSIEISSIVVNRSDRQRRELTGLQELAQSLATNGLINPILLTRGEHILIAGERRLAAAKLLGWTHISAQYQDEIEPAKLKILELEENVRRVDLPWQDRVKAVASYHEAQRSLDPEWNIERSAEQLGIARTDLSEKLSIAKEMKVNPEVEKMERYSIARNFTTRQNERRANEEIKGLEPARPKPPEAILTGSFLDWAPTYDGPKFNLIHCDFPYGVNMEKSDQAAAGRAAQGDYADSKDVYFELIACLNENVERFAADSAHMLFWFSMTFYEVTMDLLTHGGWAVNEFPLIWHKSDSVGIIPDPQRGPRRVYETALLCSRGDRKIVRAVDNAVSLPKGTTLHMSEKPIPVLTHFFRMLVDGSTSLLDPTAGSGAALCAADDLGASRIFGIELDPEFAGKANERVAKTKLQRMMKDNEALTSKPPEKVA